jgi:hypothetical protein
LGGQEQKTVIELKNGVKRELPFTFSDFGREKIDVPADRLPGRFPFGLQRQSAANSEF